MEESKPKRKYVRKAKPIVVSDRNEFLSEHPETTETTDSEPKPEPEIKQKRKYTKKLKEEGVEPKKYQKKKILKNVAEILDDPGMSDIEPLEIVPKRTPQQIVDEIYFKPPGKVVAYMYYEGSDIDTLKYIKDIQDKCHSLKLGTQVQIATNDKFEKIGIKNCFVSEDALFEFTDYCLDRKDVVCIKIKERPTMNPDELFELIKQLADCDYEDDFVQIKTLL